MTFQNIFQYRMPAGIPGQVTRLEASIIEAAIASRRHPPTVYGVPVALDDWSESLISPKRLHTGWMRPLRKGDAAADVYGFLVRPYPTQQTGEGTPISGVCDVLVRGYINAKLGGKAEAYKGGAVYARIQNPTDDQPLGGIEAEPDDKNTIQLVNAHFMGEADADGNVEIAYKM